MINKQAKLTTVDFAIKTLERKIKATDNELIKQIHEKEIDDLKLWKAEIKIEK